MRKPICIIQVTRIFESSCLAILCTCPHCSLERVPTLSKLSLSDVRLRTRAARLWETFSTREGGRSMVWRVMMIHQVV